MNNGEFYRRLEAVRKEIANLPGGDMKSTLMNRVDSVAGHHEKGKAIAASMEETLGLLRIHMQYIMLDLEATKRENTALRKRLEDHDVK